MQNPKLKVVSNIIPHLKNSDRFMEFILKKDALTEMLFLDLELEFGHFRQGHSKPPKTSAF